MDFDLDTATPKILSVKDFIFLTETATAPTMG